MTEHEAMSKKKSTGNTISKPKKRIKANRNEDGTAKSAVALMAFGNDDCDPALDWVEFRQIPVSKRCVIQYGKDLYEWARTNPSATKIRKFFRMHGINYETVNLWRKRYIEFAYYYDMSLDEIGDRREDGAYDKKKEAAIVLRTMAIYDPDYRDLIRWQAEISSKSDAARLNSEAEIIKKAVEDTLVNFNKPIKKVDKVNDLQEDDED